MNNLDVNQEIDLSRILITLFNLNKNSIGRYKLSSFLNLSLAKTRSLMDRLIESGLATTNGQSSGRRGTQLTRKGKRCSNDLLNVFFIDDESKFTKVGRQLIQHQSYQCVLLFNSKDVDGITERDIAVRAGANGAIILHYDNNNWQFPDGYKIDKEFMIDRRSKLTRFQNAMITFADKPSFCYLGSMNVLLYHSYDQIMQIISKYLEFF